MTEERSHEQIDKQHKSSANATRNVRRNTRRKLLKGAAALPVVMTLHSGAALARTSNITGEADSVENAVFMNPSDGPQLLCVLPEDNIPGTTTYDLGLTPSATLINDPNTKINLNADPGQILRKKELQRDLCHEAHQGIMISAVAFTSISSKTEINLINL